MARIQQTQLHGLEWRDVGDQLCAADFPCRSRRHELVLDHPLLERLEDDGRGVVHSERCVVVRDVGRGCGRDNAIDHRGRE